jgi:transposase
MTATARSAASPARRRKRFLVQKPQGQVTERVQRVGPEHFGIVSVDCAKERSKYMFADFYGRVLIPPTPLPHNRGDLQAALDQIRQAVTAHDIRDLIAAIERTGEYHRPVQRAIRRCGWEARLVHSFTSKQFRLAANPGDKTDDHDLAGIHRAAVNGFGLLEPELPADYQRLQLLVRHRRDLVRKMTRLCNQLREVLHAIMPGYAACFSNLWHNRLALLLARQTGSAAAVRAAGWPGLLQLVKEHAPKQRPPQRCAATLTKILAWAEQAPEGHPQSECLRSILVSLDDDRQQKTQEIQAVERACANLLTRLPYVLLLCIPGINVVLAAELAGELGPMCNYPTANNITGRAGLVPSRYQSDRVDCADGPLRRSANRRIRGILMLAADTLVCCNQYFHARADLWRHAGKDARWIRVKVAKQLSRIAFAMVASQRLFPHPCCQQRHYILDKLLAFQRVTDTPLSQVMQDLDQATLQLPRAAKAAEAEPLRQRLLKAQKSRSNAPQLLGDILPIVLARLGVDGLQSEGREDRDPS